MQHNDQGQVPALPLSFLFPFQKMGSDPVLGLIAVAGSVLSFGFYATPVRDPDLLSLAGFSQGCVAPWSDINLSLLNSSRSSAWFH